MTSQFDSREILSILVAWIVLSVGITFNNVLGLLNRTPGSFAIIVAGFIATATGFIFHEMGHKYIAMRYGYIAHFRIWVWGILLTLITAIVSKGGFLFGAPGAVYIVPAAYYGLGYYSPTRRTLDEDRANMIISAAGPAINLIFALFFFSLFYLSPPNSFSEIVSIFGFGLNVGLGSFNMIPIPPLDGYKIFKKNIILALLIALPLWIMFVYLFLLS